MMAEKFFYSTRGFAKETAEKRAALQAVMAFHREMENIFLHTADMNAAQHKFLWWQHELGRSDPADHPLAVALQNMRGRVPHLSSDCLKILVGFQENLIPVSFERFEDIVVHVMRTAGTRELLLADILQIRDSIPEEILHQFALSLALIHHLQHLHHFVRRGFVYFVEGEMQRCQVEFTDLQAFRTTEAIRLLLQSQANKAKQVYATAEATLSKTQRVLLAQLLMRCRWGLEVLRLLEKSEWRVLENFIDLTPVRKWWVSRKNRC